MTTKLGDSKKELKDALDYKSLEIKDAYDEVEEQRKELWEQHEELVEQFNELVEQDIEIKENEELIELFKKLVAVLNQEVHGYRVMITFAEPRQEEIDIPELWKRTVEYLLTQHNVKVSGRFCTS